ncbi:MAG: DEAD/DEAH box helicase [Candidatus Lokiarchaeota archaeon]|nr:DEAD/DEAH box helicase [Candidatus Lokiarchaeota archaeon]
MIDLPEKTIPFFPFSKTRPGQDELIKEIYYSVSAKKNVIIEAPNGIGKTVSALSSIIPYLKGTKKDRVLIYCTRTHSQMDQVLQELKRIQATKSVQIRGLSFKGRKNMCINQLVIDKAGSSREFVDLCNLLRSKDQCNFFNELNDAMFDVSTYLDKTMSATDLVLIGKQLHVCPYFLGKKLIANVDLIATTFQYMVNPFIRSIFLKDLQKEMPELILLFDECHNLPDLAMEVGSDKLPLSSIRRAYDELLTVATLDHPAIKLFDFHHELLEKKLAPYLQKRDIDEIDFEVSSMLLREILKLMEPDPTEFVMMLKNLGRKIKKDKIENSSRKRSISYLLRYAQFLELLLHSIDDPQYLHRFLVLRTKTGNTIVHEIKCLDCRIILRQLYEARSTIFLSGTLSPLLAFMEIIGLHGETTSRKTVTSPFSPKQLLIGVVPGLTSKFEHRNSTTYEKIKDYVVHVAEVTPCNTGVFVPSYAYLHALRSTNLEMQLKKKKIALYEEHKQFLTKKQDAMIQEFKLLPKHGKKGVLLGVLGGRYSEGVDFPGDEMNSVLITGVPLSRPTYLITKLEEFYDKAFGGKGREYGYIIPAMRKANQAAGRPVRRLSDKGAIIFLDERYNSKYYKKFLSSWILKNFQQLPSNPKLLADKIKQFFL